MPSSGFENDNDSAASARNEEPRELRTEVGTKVSLCERSYMPGAMVQLLFHSRLCMVAIQFAAFDDATYAAFHSVFYAWCLGGVDFLLYGHYPRTLSRDTQSGSNGTRGGVCDREAAYAGRGWRAALYARDGGTGDNVDRDGEASVLAGVWRVADDRADDRFAALRDRTADRIAQKYGVGSGDASDESSAAGV
jgi:hypothetical protein